MTSSTGVRYSDGKPASDTRAQFPWEYGVPDVPFWNDLSFLVGRNFLCNFTSPAEIAALPIDPQSTQSPAQKLALLEQLLRAHLAARDAAAAPKTFYEIDYPAWDRLWLGIFTMQQEQQQQHPKEAEQTMRMLCARRRDESNLSHFHTLAALLLARGAYSEAEEMEGPVRVWLDEKLGRDSPQALGARRIIVQAVWGQGAARREHARQLIGDLESVIEGMGDEGPYAMYQEEERGYVRAMVDKLEKGDGVSG